MARASYLPTASPEAVGLSSSRLRQAMEVLQAEVEADRIPGEYSASHGVGSSRFSKRSAIATSKPASRWAPTRYSGWHR